MKENKIMSHTEFAYATTLEKCEDIFRSFEEIIYGRFKAREFSVEEDVSRLKIVKNKLSMLAEGEISVYLSFVQEKIKTIQETQMGSDKISNYTLFGQIIRNLPESSDKQNIKVIKELKKSLSKEILEEAVKD